MLKFGDDLRYRLEVAAANGEPMSAGLLQISEKNTELPEFLQECWDAKVRYCGDTPYRVRLICTANGNGSTDNTISDFDSRMSVFEWYANIRQDIELFEAYVECPIRFRVTVGEGEEAVKEVLSPENQSNFRMMHGQHCRSSHVYYYKDRCPVSYLDMCARFYTKVAPCKVISVRDTANKVMAYSFIWDDVLMYDMRDKGLIQVTFLDHIRGVSGAACDFLCRAAKDKGVQIYAGLSGNPVILNPIPDIEDLYYPHFAKPIKVDLDYPGYMPGDSFFDGVALLEASKRLCVCDYTDYVGSYPWIRMGQICEFSLLQRRQICPVCGESYSEDEFICPNCATSLHISTPFGDFGDRQDWKQDENGTWSPNGVNISPFNADKFAMFRLFAGK